MGTASLNSRVLIEYVKINKSFQIDYIQALVKLIKLKAFLAYRWIGAYVGTISPFLEPIPSSSYGLRTDWKLCLLPLFSFRGSFFRFEPRFCLQEGLKIGNRPIVLK